MDEQGDLPLLAPPGNEEEDHSYSKVLALNFEGSGWDFFHFEEQNLQRPAWWADLRGHSELIIKHIRDGKACKPWENAELVGVVLYETPAGWPIHRPAEEYLPALQALCRYLATPEHRGLLQRFLEKGCSHLGRSIYPIPAAGQEEPTVENYRHFDGENLVQVAAVPAVLFGDEVP